MVVTDLDGTLLRSDQTLDPRDRETLHWLGEKGVVRVVATGRSLYSARRVLDLTFPIDYLVFSTGAGIADWRSERLLRSSAMPTATVASCVARLRDMKLDFMVHEAVPDNHRFIYVEGGSGRPNPDFHRRIERYADVSRSEDDAGRLPSVVSQILAVIPAEQAARIPVLEQAFPEVQVIRATSPLDGASIWIEMFSPGVCKSDAANWLAEREGKPSHQVLGIGNDYNDLDLLRWAGSAYVVSNAPADLLSAHRVVRSHQDAGFTDAVTRWWDDKAPSAT